MGPLEDLDHALSRDKIPQPRLGFALHVIAFAKIRAAIHVGSMPLLGRISFPVLGVPPSHMGRSITADLLHSAHWVSFISTNHHEVSQFQLMTTWQPLRYILQVLGHGIASDRDNHQALTALPS
jgi:hypothetical protein